VVAKLKLSPVLAQVFLAGSGQRSASNIRAHQAMHIS